MRIAESACSFQTRAIVAACACHSAAMLNINPASQALVRACCGETMAIRTETLFTEHAFNTRSAMAIANQRRPAMAISR